MFEGVDCQKLLFFIAYFIEEILTLVTHIWLVVRVPVLSEQMTEVQPRVSTEGRLLTMAFFLAIRRVPRAKQVVMTAGRPERHGTTFSVKQ